MPKIRHIAIASDDPEATAAFYREMFEFEEVGRIGRPGDEKAIAWGVYLSDGVLNLAVLKFQNVDQLGRGLDYVGLHHFGVLVDDLAACRARLEAAGAPCILEAPPTAPGDPPNYETKFRGPEGVVFDVSEHPWIGAQAL
jgi:catechol 2,3-dioxygenase-like lactoylglutathione lyase family enzyme